MARPGLAKSEVKQACEAIAAQGRYPSVDAVRRELGDRGSKSTIHRLLKELDADTRAPAPMPGTTATELRNIIDSLIARLDAAADLRVAQVRAEHTELVRRQAAEIAYLKHQVNTLNLRLRLAGESDGHALVAGFGDPHGLSDNNRAGRAGFSRIDSFFNSRSSRTSSTVTGQNGGDLFWRI